MVFLKVFEFQGVFTQSFYFLVFESHQVFQGFLLVLGLVFLLIGQFLGVGSLIKLVLKGDFLGDGVANLYLVVMQASELREIVDAILSFVLAKPFAGVCGGEGRVGTRVCSDVGLFVNKGEGTACLLGMRLVALFLASSETIKHLLVTRLPIRLSVIAYP